MKMPILLRYPLLVIKVAKKLGLNYSTAKTLARNYKGVPEEHNQDLMTRIC